MPGDDVPLHVPERFEIGVVVGLNLALVLVTWVLTSKYTRSLLDEDTEARAVPDAGPLASH